MMDFTVEGFNAFARQIADLNGITPDEAAEALVDIGDALEFDEQGLAVRRDASGAVIGRYVWPDEDEDAEEDEEEEEDLSSSSKLSNHDHH